MKGEQDAVIWKPIYLSIVLLEPNYKALNVLKFTLLSYGLGSSTPFSHLVFMCHVNEMTIYVQVMIMHTCIGNI